VRFRGGETEHRLVSLTAHTGLASLNAGMSATADGDGEQAMPPPVSAARERLLDAAYGLFSRHGLHAVGIDRIVADADVAKATLYHHFPSKDALVVAFLQLREQRWTYGWLVTEAERRAATPKDRAVVVFDAMDEWFHRADFEGCSFLNTLLEVSDRDSPVHQETVRRLAVVAGIFQTWAQQAGSGTPQETGHQLQILAIGSIVSAGRADLEAARRARPVAAALVASARTAGTRR
jgi:AcrR family transcriptional regulator